MNADFETVGTVGISWATRSMEGVSSSIYSRAANAAGCKLFKHGDNSWSFDNPVPRSDGMIGRGGYKTAAAAWRAAFEANKNTCKLSVE